jgi:hypothetical protein
MSRRSVPRGLVSSIAFFGVFVGHALTYVVLAWSPAARSTILAATGHRYLPVAVHGGLALAVIVLGAAFLGRLGPDAADVPPFAKLIPRVATFQVLTFIAIEVAERLAASAPLHDLTHVLPVGLIAQCMVAAAVTLLIRLVLGAADAAAPALDGLAVSPPRGLVPLTPAPVVALPFRDAPVVRGRGPPS